MSASPAHMPQVAKRTVKSSFLNYLITLNLSFDLQLLATVQRPYPPQLHIMFALKKKEKGKHLFPLKMSAMIIKPKAPLKTCFQVSKAINVTCNISELISFSTEGSLVLSHRIALP